MQMHIIDLGALTSEGMRSGLTFSAPYLVAKDVAIRR